MNGREPSPLHHTDVDGETERITGVILDAGIKVRRALGPGMREWVYRDGR